MNKEAYYFSHDANARHDPNISEMRADYGSEGYGWYWIVVEMMREQADYKLKLCKCNAFAMQMQCATDAAKKYIDDCIKKYELFTSDGEYFWSESLIRRMKLKEEKSEKARQSALSRWDNKQDANAMRPQCERNASKGKESKEKDTNYTKEFETFWGEYPRKKEKKGAFTKFKATKNKGVDAGKLILAASNYRKECEHNGTAENYIKLPRTFLGPDEHWSDYLVSRKEPATGDLPNYTGASDEQLYGGGK